MIFNCLYIVVPFSHVIRKVENTEILTNMTSVLVAEKNMLIHIIGG